MEEKRWLQVLNHANEIEASVPTSRPANCIEYDGGDDCNEYDDGNIDSGNRSNGNDNDDINVKDECSDSDVEDYDSNSEK